MYDSWGKLLDISGTLASTIGLINPYRYRGYRYDTETGLYYLQSRYYDPVIGRFLNADAQLNQGINGVNLFAYCNNNSINMSDVCGYVASYITMMTDGTNYCKIIKPIIDSEQPLTVISTKINLNDDYDDQIDQKPDKGPSSYKKSRERKQIKDAWGKDRAAREKKSKDLHDSKKGQRNDDNRDYGQLESGNVWDPMVSQMFVIGGGIVLAFLIVNDATVVGVADDHQIPVVIDFIETNLPKCFVMP